MAGTPTGGGAPVTDKRELVAYLEGGAKPAADWRIGTEHEKFAFRRRDFHPLPYDGPGGIRAILEGMTRFGWRTVLENGNPIALTKGDCNVSLEPGGQFELSGAPLKTVHETCDEVGQHLVEVKEICEEIDAGMIGLGFNPKWRREDIPWMPKGRYAIMRRYMPLVGKLGLDMMLRTCTVQVNLDFGSEADMVKKFRVSLALQPIATALFAASPFTEGRPNGFKSFRSQIWLDTDPNRSGMLPFVFEPGMGYERYVDYLLDVPMYFVYRDGKYIDVAGQSFRAFMAGKLETLPGERPSIGDFVDHMSTAFPEVRLKRYLEMRGADGGPWRRLCALPALWVGLLYDETALDAAWDMVKDWTDEERAALRREVPRYALLTPFRRRTIRELAGEMLAIAQDGLTRRARRNAAGDDESFFLDTLFAIAGSGRTYADELLDSYNGIWQGDIDNLFRERAY
jgi:glutamate--cysteine ligase